MPTAGESQGRRAASRSAAATSGGILPNLPALRDGMGALVKLLRGQCR